MYTTRNSLHFSPKEFTRMMDDDALRVVKNQFAMIVLGSNSDVAQAFVEKTLQAGEKFSKIYLFTSNVETTQKFARHLEVKFVQQCEIILLDLLNPVDYAAFEQVHSSLLFCAAGYLGSGTQDALYDNRNTQLIVDINYARLIPVLNHFAEKMQRRRQGTMIVLSSVAGDRGRQSNFIYGSAKAGLTAYLSGLRNYMITFKVHVLTIKPGFMATKMTEGLPLNPKLTASPEQAAAAIYRAYKNKANTAYILPIWWLIMLVIRNIPEFIFKRMKL